MKVITGTAKGRRLITVEGTEVVRPTLQKVKEAIFSAIQFDVPYARVLDLFCGSGQLGIEALSRGAEHCVFVDSSKRSQEVTKQNLINTGLFKQSRVVAMDYKSYLSTTKDRFQIVFLDPPYGSGLLQEALTLLSDKMCENSVIFCEHSTKEELPESFGDFYIKKIYKYGRISVTSYTNAASV